MPTSTRGDFLRQLGVLIASTRFGGIDLPIASSAGPGVAAPPPDNLVGIQMGAHTMLDEGVEHVLDLCQETASIDTLFTYCYSYGGDVRKPIAWLAKDHGVSVIDQQTRTLPNVWVKQHEQYYKDTSLRHPKVDASFAYHDRDLCTEMIKAKAPDRGVRRN